MSGPLGGQTVTVIAQRRAQHNTRVDGARRAYPGCSVQPAGLGSETLDEGREQQTTRWTLYAPPGFRAGGDDVCIAEPGPTDADGSPERLAFEGPARIWPDETGAEHHVEAGLHRVSST